MKNILTTLLFTLVFLLISASIGNAQLYINEFLASNDSGLTDESGDYEDWIEIYNAGSTAINLAGYYISDDISQPLLWQIPADNANLTTVSAGGFLILWADKDIADGANHLNIKLGASGEDIILVDPDGSTIHDQYTFPSQITDVSFGRVPDGGSDWDYFAQPTPGQTNDSPPGAPQVFAPTFSIDGGFYSGSVEVNISSLTLDAEIYYTLDGSYPTENDTEYSGPITIDENTALRARAFLDPLIPSSIVTESYLFDISHTFPVVAYTVDPDEMFDPEDGMYPNCDEDIEINANIELYETDGSNGFNQLVETEINGGGSNAIKSLALKAKSSLGSSTIDYQIFPDFEEDKYRSLILRNSGQEWNKSVFRDAMAISLVLDESDINGSINTIVKPKIYGQAYRPGITYINGEYWGILNIRERIDKRYIKVHFDLDDNEIDFIENVDEVKEGDLVAWDNLVDFIDGNNLSSDANYQIVADQVDIENYIDYIALNVYLDNSDWPGNNNRKFRKREAGSKWKYLNYDLDFTFGLNVDGESWNSGVNTANSLERLLTLSNSWPNPSSSTFLFRNLMENDQFKTLFVNRMADQLNLLFDDDRVINRIDEFENQYAPEIDQHADRWQGGLSSWSESVQILRNFADGRADNVRDHFIDEIDEIGDISEVTINLNNANEGEVSISTISVHTENAPFTGIYFEGIDIPVSAFPNRGYVLENWSGDLSGNDPFESININSNTTVTANFGPGSNATDQIVINEINYNSLDNNSSDDWVELYNPNAFAVDISGWYFEDESGEFFGIPANTILQAGDYLVLVETGSKFSTIYPQVNNFIGDFGIPVRGFGLSNKGELITLKNAASVLIDEVEYDDNYPWPTEADGEGPTLQLIDPELDNTLASSWEAIPATPGTLNGTSSSQNQSINFSSISDQLNINTPFQISATATSGLPVSFTILSGPATISGNTITLNGTTGIVVVQASQGGNPDWNPAPNVNQSFTVFEYNLPPPTGDYCDSESEAPWHEWIAGVQLNTINNPSPKDQYSDFTNISTTLDQGANYPIILTAGFSYTTYEEYFRVWIDFNQNNVFDEPGEIAFSGIVTGVPYGTETSDLLGSINIPGNALPGATRMRVSMQRDAYASPCGDFQFGEVEDYTIIINEGNATELTLSNCHDDIIQTAEPGETEVNVTWFGPTATTTCNPNTTTLNQTEGPPSGSAFSIGSTTTIEYTATDQCGNQESCSFTITINAPDNGSINLTCPSDISIISEAGQNGALVNWTEPAGSSSCPNGGYSLNQIGGLPNGSFFTEGSYQIGYQATDNCGNIENCSFNITVLPENSGGDYCESESDFPWHEWIAGVQLNDINNVSGKSNYSDFTNITTDLTPGGSYPFLLTSGYSWTTHDEHWKVWIDYNQNGTFEEPSETAFYGIQSAPPNGTDNGFINGIISVPTDAPGGNTRMRIAMKRGAEPGPCEILPFGEIEDYTIIISSSSNSGGSQASYGNKPPIQLFPNPAKGEVTLIVPDQTELEQIDIFNIASKNVLNLKGVEGQTIYSFNVNQFMEGLYFLQLKYKDGRRTTRRLLVSPGY